MYKKLYNNPYSLHMFLHTQKATKTRKNVNPQLQTSHILLNFLLVFSFHLEQFSTNSCLLLHQKNVAHSCTCCKPELTFLKLKDRLPNNCHISYIVLEHHTISKNVFHVKIIPKLRKYSDKCFSCKNHTSKSTKTMLQTLIKMLCSTYS